MYDPALRLIHFLGFFKKRTIRHITIGLISLYSLIGCGSSDATPQGIGPLTDIVFSGSVEGWAGSTREGIYWLENEAGNPDDIRYFYTPSSPGDNGKRSVQVEVKTDDRHPDSRAGLLYGYRESPRFYYLIMASGSDKVDIYLRDGNGIRLSQSSSINANKSGFVHIEAREKGQQLTVLANGKTITTIENDNLSRGELGIAAFGQGRFGFTNYEQSPSIGNSTAYQEPTNRKAEVEKSRSSSASAPERKLQMLEFIDPKNGMVQYRSPYPKGWRFDTNPNDQLALTGPNGVQVYQTDSGRYVYSNDSFALQSAQQMGGAQISPVVPLGQFLTQRYSPYMEQRGFKLSKHYPMPEIVDFWEVIGATMPQGLSRKQYDAIGAEWNNSDGTRAFTILVQHMFQDQAYIIWSVTAGELYSSNAEFESARDVYAYASAKTEMNPQWQIFMNNQLLANIKANQNYWRDRTKESQVQHIGRMNAILARGQSASSVAKINSDILDISHAGYLKRDSMVSAGQAKTVNMIGEQSVITNPSTGELYKVDAGAGNYWVNAEGKYFPTDNTLYDPRTDISISDQQWERFDIVE